MTKRILTITESDTSGGSGLQGDIKTITALGGYATSALVSLAVQNTCGVIERTPVPTDFVLKQIRAVLDDIGTDAIKTAFLRDANLIDQVCDILDEVQNQGHVIVVDPSMVNRAGDCLMDTETIATFKRRLVLRATVMTPNLQEAELLTGMDIHDIDDMKHAADMMRTLGAEAIVLKGGQCFSEKASYLVAAGDTEVVLETDMNDNRHSHGAGDLLASAIATLMAEGKSVIDTVELALDFLNHSIEEGHDFGKGVGPVNHTYAIEQHRKQA